MDDNTKKEEFSYGYIKIIAAVSGLEVNIAGRPSDNAGIDIIIKAPDIIQGVFSPRIDAQVKCTSGDILKDEFIKFTCKVNNYKRLMGFSSAPQILIVVIVPKTINTWLTITNNDTLVKGCAYWISLTGEEITKNKKSVTIDIPKKIY